MRHIITHTQTYPNYNARLVAQILIFTWWQRKDNHQKSAALSAPGSNPNELNNNKDNLSCQ